MSKITQVVKRSGAVVDFTPERITNAIYRAAVSVGGRDRAIAARLSAEVIAILEAQSQPEKPPTIEQIQDVVEKVLIENGHARVAKAYILYRDERARLRSERAERASHPSKNIPWSKIWRVLNWAVDHGVHTIAGLNERIARSEFAQIVTETEAAYTEDIENAVETIRQRAGQLKLVIITGPSSSGKTTTMIKVAQRLERLGWNLVTLNVDHYFFDLAVHPQDEFGDYDFETPQALDIDLINRHLTALIAGEEVRIPYYDFKTGTRQLDHTPMRLHENEVILIDSLHGLHPPMTAGIADEQKFKLYLEPLLQMKKADGQYVRWTDLRLIRRMLRDATHRAYDPRRTLEHWHYVRSSELRHIIPNIGSTDYIVNTAMPYELPIYGARLLAEFQQWVADYRHDPLREDAYQRAARVFDLLQQVTAFEDEAAIPSDSVLREFIGGSSYEY